MYMTRWNLSSVASSLSVVAVLTSCGGSQPPIGAPGAMPRSHANAARNDRGASWMLPEAKSQDLIYAEGAACEGICILRYPDGKRVGNIALSETSGGDCSDRNGNVFVTNDSQVLKFAHGGTTPIASLSLPGTDAQACGVDPATGNLAVLFSGSGANVAVFASASGTPATYETYMFSWGCGYDNSGNLFVSGLNGQIESHIALRLAVTLAAPRSARSLERGA